MAVVTFFNERYPSISASGISVVVEKAEKAEKTKKNEEKAKWVKARSGRSRICSCCGAKMPFTNSETGYPNIGNWILAIIQFIISTFSGMLCRVSKKETDRIGNNEKRVDEVEKRLCDFEKKVISEYMKKSKYDNKEVLEGLKNLEIKMSEQYMKRDEFFRYYRNRQSPVYSNLHYCKRADRVSC